MKCTGGQRLTARNARFPWNTLSNAKKRRRACFWLRKASMRRKSWSTEKSCPAKRRNVFWIGISENTTSAPYVREGINTIVLVFTIRPLRLGFDLKTAHDAIRNKFSYPVEAESVYLIGDFSVQPKGAVTENISYIRTEDGVFA